MFFVQAEKHKGSLENIRMGGYKSKRTALKAAKKYPNALVQEYGNKGLVPVFIRHNSVNIME